MSQHKVSYALAYVTSFSQAHIKKKKKKNYKSRAYMIYNLQA